MKKLLVGSVILSLASLPALADLKTGDAAPEFGAQASVNGDKFAAAGASIVGVSLDSIQRLNDFSKDPAYCAGKFPTASDSDGKIAKSFDVAVSTGTSSDLDTRGQAIGHNYADRTTFIV